MKTQVDKLIEALNSETGWVWLSCMNEKEKLQLLSELEDHKNLFYLVDKYLGDLTEDNFQDVLEYVEEMNDKPEPPEGK